MRKFYIAYLNDSGKDREVVIPALTELDAIRWFTLDYGMLEITEVFEMCSDIFAEEKETA
jgi:hypothetical protein